MKFSIAISLLLAGLAQANLIIPKEAQVDHFLRENQNLKPTTELESFSQNGQIYEAVYKDGPVTIKYDVTQNQDTLKIVGIEEVISFSGFSQTQNQNINQEQPEQLLPLPIFMPTFEVQNDNQIAMNNAFEAAELEMHEMEQKMEKQREQFEQMMNKKMPHQRNHKKEHNKKPKGNKLLGGGDHDFKRIENQQPLLGGGDHDDWVDSQSSNQPLLGGGDHDFNRDRPEPHLIGGGDHDFKRIQIEKQPILGGDDHDNWLQKSDHPIIGGDDHDNWQQKAKEFQQPIVGGDDHDNWQQKARQFEHPIIGGDHDNWQQKAKEFQHPIVGGDDHDNWQQKAQQFQHPIIGGDHDNWQQNAENNLLGRQDHDNWRNTKHHRNRGGKHHDHSKWSQREFTNQQVQPYLRQKLPDMMEGNTIISLQSKGFERGRGFEIDIQLKDSEGVLSNVNAFYRPRHHQFVINKIEKVKNEQTTLDIGLQVIGDILNNLEANILRPAIELEGQKAQEHQLITQNIVPPQFISIQKPLLLGGSGDPDNDPEFMKIPIQLELQSNHIQDNHIQDNHIQDNHIQNNHIQNPEPQEYQVPLLGGENDPDHEINYQIFDISNLPLPGSQSDPDHKLQQFLSQITDIVLKVQKNLSSESVQSVIEDIQQDQIAEQGKPMKVVSK